jgi:hypothetical protein
MFLTHQQEGHRPNAEGPASHLRSYQFIVCGTNGVNKPKRLGSRRLRRWGSGVTVGRIVYAVYR